MYDCAPPDLAGLLTYTLQSSVPTTNYHIILGMPMGRVYTYVCYAVYCLRDIDKALLAGALF